MKKFLAMAMLSHVFLVSNAQAVDSYELILTNEQHFEWLDELASKGKEQQLEMIQIRVAVDTLFKPGSDVPLAISGQHQQVCKIAMIVAGYAFNFSDAISNRTITRLMDALQPKHIQAIEVLTEMPEGLSIEREWCGLIVITLDKRSSKRIEKMAR